jgi:ribosomal-protein-alanine N-acetyltransferase
MITMPALETNRLQIRPFVMEDLEAIYHLLDIELVEADLRTDKMETLAERRAWLQWTVLNYEQLAKMYQPPYGDRAVTLGSTRQLIGACGYVPCLMPFEQLPGFASGDRPAGPSLSTTEFGLFYAISPTHQRNGYATEAAKALIDYAFRQLRLKRVVAKTNYDNYASMGVMHKLGMRVEINPLPEPPWLQVAGGIENQQ